MHVREAGAAVVVGGQAGEEKGGGAGAGPGGAGRQHCAAAAQTLRLCFPLPAGGSLSSSVSLAPLASNPHTPVKEALKLVGCWREWIVC